ncbi:ATP-dependent DNA helicase PIF1, partial [Phenoliferia sp. Uapishka_3]
MSSDRTSRKRRAPTRFDEEDFLERPRVRPARAATPPHLRQPQQRRSTKRTLDDVLPEVGDDGGTDACVKRCRPEKRLCGVKATSHSQACRRHVADGLDTCDQHGHKSLSGVDIPIAEWPPFLSPPEVQELHKVWRERFAPDQLVQRTCASCAQFHDAPDSNEVTEFDPDTDFSPLAVPPDFLPKLRRNHPGEWHNLFSFGTPWLEGLMLEPGGIAYNSESTSFVVHICDSCLASLDRAQRPDASLANGTWTGPIPPQLEALTEAEQVVLGVSRSSQSAIFFLKSPIKDGDPSTRQRGTKGHFVSWPQYSDRLMKAVTTLPRPPSELAEAFQVTLVGPPPFDESALRYSFAVSPARIRDAFNWLKTRSRIYDGVIWDEKVANLYDGGVPESIQRSEVLQVDLEEAERVGYVPRSAMDPGRDEGDETGSEAEEEPIISSSAMVDGNGMRASTQERRAAALHAVIDPTSASRFVIPRSNTLDSSFNPELLPRLCVREYPYGVGGFGDKSTSAYEAAPALSTHIRSLLLRADQRFAEHRFWIFFSFDLHQRMLVGRNTKVRMSRSSGKRVASGIAGLTAAELSELSMAIEAGEQVKAGSSADKLLQSCQWITGGLVGSAQSRLNSRKDLFALVTAFGNVQSRGRVGDAHNVLTIFFAGGVLHLDEELGLTSHLPSAQARQRLVAKNPVAAARTFHSLITAFINILIQPCRDGSMTGIMGKALAVYTILETQGRGSLHAHGKTTMHALPSRTELLNRLQDPVNVEWKDRFLHFIDTHIKNEFDEQAERDVERLHQRSDWSNSFSLDDRHPTIRPAPDPYLPSEEYEAQCEIDRAIVGSRTLLHSHNRSCTRKNLDKSTCTPSFRRWFFVLSTHVSDEGRIVQKRLSSVVNSHNPVAIRFDHMRCNHDLKALFLDPRTAAFSYYMTKYMTKTELSLHRFYALASIAANIQVESRLDCSTDLLNAKQLITKCCNRVGAEMEYSAPAVAFYLLFRKDHFSSETFEGLHLAMFSSRIVAMENEARGEGDDDAFESVTVEVDAETAVVVEHNQADNYILRAHELDGECLYLFVSRYEVITSRGDRAQDSRSSRGRPANRRYNFLPPHPRYLTHRLKERDIPAVPRIEGRTVPRRDATTPQAREWYAKSILILFRPWRTLGDLLGGAVCWEDALALFEPSEAVQRYIDNLQLLHRMKADAVNEMQTRQYPPMKMANSLERDEDEVDELGLDDVLSPEEAAKALEEQLALDPVDLWNNTALSILASEGYFTPAPASQKIKDAISLIENNIRQRSQHDLEQTAVWDLELKDQDAKNEARRKYGGSVAQDGTQAASGSYESGHERPGIGIVEQEGSHRSNLSPVAHARRHNLNFKQTLAFLLLVHNALAKKKDNQSYNTPVLISGEGGTGKSRVINAFTEWMDDRGWMSRLRVAAPTATAASKISGETIHRVAGITRPKKTDSELDDFDAQPAKTKQGSISDATREALEPVENIIIDEVSMLGHNIHGALHQTCCLAKAGKSSDAHMGGINVAYFGDFLQFLPVLDTALFSRPKKQSLNLWLNVTDVILLDEQMRQDPAQVEFMKTLRKVRFRECDAEDYHLLQQRILGTPGGPTLHSPGWLDTLFIVQRHTLRREVNRRRAITHAQSLNQPLFLSPAIYSSKKVNITSKEVRMLRNLPPKKHDNLESVLYLTLGMPLVLYENSHTSQGITNGAYGTLVGIQLHPDSCATPNPVGFQEIVLSHPPALLLVLLATSHKYRKELSDLPPDTIPVITRHGTAKLVLEQWKDAQGKGHSHSTSIQIEQCPVSPAWAVTDYRIQGDTTPLITADLSPPTGGSIDPAAAYVAMSRVTTFEGLSFLRDFPIRVLRGGLEQDLRDELARQESQQAKTLRKVQEIIDQNQWREQYEEYAADRGFQ